MPQITANGIQLEYEAYGDPAQPPLLLAQRFVYRQLMYGVVIRSLVAALRGRMVGWGKLERSGSVIGAG